MDKLFHEAGVAIVAFVASLIPAALGSAVSLVFEPDVSWPRRTAQMMVGVIVSYFVTNASVVLSPWQPVDLSVKQALGFVLGMIAFRATPKFIAGAGEALGAAPGRLLDRALAFLPGRKDAK